MTDSDISYRAAVRFARRHITDCCYGRPCLEECLRRLGASLPPCACAGGWRPPRWAKWLALAAVLVALAFAAFQARADVQCIWNGQSYVCSGTGNRVEVIGGTGGTGEPVVVTNFWGVCTNCVSMAPETCEALKQDIISSSDATMSALQYVVSESSISSWSLSAMQDDISTFRRFSNLPGSGGLLSWASFTNYIYTVDNTQTSLLKSYVPKASTSSRQLIASYSNGIYDYAQTLSTDLSNLRSRVDSVKTRASGAEQTVSRLKSAANDISCEQCQPEYEPGAGGLPGGSAVVTNGNWCTFEQGEAIKGLLGELKEWAQRQHSQLSAISNYVEASYETLRSGLYSDYTAIPRGEDWQTLYLNGQPTGWGYDPTNIIQRIEVLLYGISGISTNTASLQDTTPSAEDTVDDVSDATASISTDADGTAVTTLGNAVLDFFRSFTPRTKDYQGGEEIIAEVSIDIGDDTHYVPAMRLGSSGFLVDTMSAVKVFVNGFCSVLYWVVGAFVIFRFWAWFSAWCVRLSKWAVELCTSLFAS